MNCTSFRQHIDDYIDNSLSDTLKNEMHLHITECGECKRELEDMQKIVKCMNSMPEIPVPDDFLDKLNKRIDETNTFTAAVRRFDRRKIFNYRTYSAAAACILLLVMVKADIPKMLSYGALRGGSEQSVKSVLPKNAVDQSDMQTDIPDTLPQTGTAVTPSATDSFDNNKESADSYGKAVEKHSDTAKAENSSQEYGKSTADTLTSTVPEDKHNNSGADNADVSAIVQPENTPTGTPKTVSDKADTVSPETNQIENAVTAYSLDGSEDLEEQNVAKSRKTELSGNVLGAQGPGKKAASGAAAAPMTNTVLNITLSAEYKQSALTALSSIGAEYNGKCYVLESDKMEMLLSVLDENGVAYTYAVSENSGSGFLDIYLCCDTIDK